MTVYTNLKNLSVETFAIGAAGSEVTINPEKFTITGIIKDVATASISWSGVSPYTGVINTIYSSLYENSLNTAGDSVLSFKINATSASDVTGGGITIAASSGIGAVDSSSPTANRAITAGQNIAVVSDGGGNANTAGGSTTSPAILTFVCTRT